MPPLIRNSGETLGVKAYLDTKVAVQQRFVPSVNIANLNQIEKWLTGDHPLENDNKFNGLRAPK